MGKHPKKARIFQKYSEIPLVKAKKSIYSLTDQRKPVRKRGAKNYE
jgi:hypothetical protein